VTEERAKRKLTAIFSADVAGYSRLMPDNEEAAVRTINAYREVMTGLITDNRGRVVDAKGDNVLAEFPSVVDAVRCAVVVQKELRARNTDLPENRKMEFRIGVNLGDVIEEGAHIYGDAVKSQIGATIIHRTLMDLFRKRGAKCERTYQLNIGGNTDFLNMLDRSRLHSKKISKTEGVQSVSGSRLPDQDIHVGPSDYISWQKDNKICFIRMEGTYFGETSMHLDLRLSVEDSPNSAGAVIDAVRYCKLALGRGKGGVLNSASAFLMKHPPRQMSDEQAFLETQKFITGARED